MRVYALRLVPGQDLKQELQGFTQAQGLQAGFILTAVGSLAVATLRFAGQDHSVVYRERFEIVSLVGTLCPTGVHLHLCLANAQGQVVGGHLMPGCLIYTTAEILLGEGEDFRFRRALDPTTGYAELVIEPTKAI